MRGIPPTLGLLLRAAQDARALPIGARALDGRFAALLAGPGPGWRIEGGSGDLVLRDRKP